jgi:hypothetical protein
MRFSWWYYEEFDSFQSSKHGKGLIFKNADLSHSFLKVIAGTYTPASVLIRGKKRRSDRLYYYSSSKTIICQHSDYGLLGCHDNNVELYERNDVSEEQVASGCAIAQAVSLRLLTPAARVQTRV